MKICNYLHCHTCLYDVIKFAYCTLLNLQVPFLQEARFEISSFVINEHHSNFVTGSGKKTRTNFLDDN